MAEKTIGGSLLAAILGLSRYKTPYQAWLELTGRAEKEEVSNAARRGLIAEKFILEWLKEEEGFYIAETQKKFINGFVHGTIDAVGEREGKKLIIEIKTTNQFIDELPIEWQLQVNWYMALSGIHEAVIAVCNPRFEVELKHLSFDKDIHDIVYQKISEWYEKYIVNDLPPKDISYFETLTELKKEVVELPVEIIPHIEKLKEISKKIKDLEKEKEISEAAIKMALGENEEGFLGEVKVSWKTQTRELIDTKSLREQMPEVYDKFKKISIFRVFKIKI